VHAKRLGWPGSEPAGLSGRIQRFGSQGFAVAGLIVVAAGGVEIGAAVAFLALALGFPSAWVWAHDRLSAACWVIAAGLLAAAEIAFAAGGHGAREPLGAHGRAGTAAALIGICTLIQMAGYLRRWGTKGNLAVRVGGITKGDPAAVANEEARRERGRGL
jgi:hypothetical protein